MQTKSRKQIPSTRGTSRVHFPQQQRISIVEEVGNGLSRKDACLKYGMAYCTLTEWIKRHGQPEQRIRISNQRKREIVRAVTEGRMTVKEARLACNVVRSDTIRSWIRKAAKESVNLASVNDSSMPSPIDTVADAQKELAAAKLKIAALETMIDIAEQQFKISIRKNSGAKQSPQ